MHHHTKYLLKSLSLACESIAENKNLMSGTEYEMVGK